MEQLLKSAVKIGIDLMQQNSAPKEEPVPPAGWRPISDDKPEPRKYAPRHKVNEDSESDSESDSDLIPMSRRPPPPQRQMQRGRLAYEVPSLADTGEC